MGEVFFLFYFLTYLRFLDSNIFCSMHFFTIFSLFNTCSFFHFVIHFIIKIFNLCVKSLLLQLSASISHRRPFLSEDFGSTLLISHHFVFVYCVNPSFLSSFLCIKWNWGLIFFNINTLITNHVSSTYLKGLSYLHI